MGKRIFEPAENPSFIDHGQQGETKSQKKKKPCRVCSITNGEPTPHVSTRLHTDTNETEKRIRS